jgi:beta-lactamase regulating signal transducer with metallopeptidase domain
MIDIGLPLVLGVVARTTAVLLLALGATTLLRRASAATRHLVWTVALGGVLVLPFLGRFVPEWRIVPVPVELAPAASWAGEPVSAAEPVVIDHEPAEVAHGSAPAAPQAPRTDWMMWIVGLWAAGGAVLLLRLAYGVLRIWWVERRSAELADAGWTSLTDGLARRLRIGRMVTLLRGEHASVPMTWGIVRPVVLLPAEADEWSEERRTVVLAHELAHIRRWDALTQWIAHLAVAVHWYNPLVWAAARRLRQEREQACDDAVLALGARPTEYADHLLSIVRSLGTASGPAAALAMARRSQFEGRLLAILDAAVPRTGVGRAVALATLAGGAVFILPLAALSPRFAAAPEYALAAPAQETEPAEPVEVPEVPEAPHAPDPLLDAELVEPAGFLEVPEPPMSVREAPAGLLGMVTSDSLMASLRQNTGADLYAEIIRMAAAMESSTERRLVLDELMNHADLRREHVVAIIEATRTMDSDTDRRLVLMRAASHRALGGQLPPAFVEAMGRFTSSTEQRLVLLEVMRHLHPNPSALAALLRMTTGMDSDTEKRLVLVKAAESFRIEGAVRDAYMAAANTIGSDSERRLVLSALMGRTSPATRASTVRSPGGLWETTTEHVGEHHGEPAYTLSVHARGVRLNGDRSDVTEVLQGGALEIEHVLLPGYPDADPLIARGSRATVKRTLSVRRGSNGALVRSYRVNGSEREFGGEGRAWLARVLRSVR